MLALVQPAEARIVYTPAHVVIGRGGLHLYRLDLNHDKITDFTIQTSYYTFRSTHGSINLFASARLNGIQGGSTDGRGFASKLYRGAVIGPGRTFHGGQIGIADVFQVDRTSTDSGGWCDWGPHYLGLKFRIGKQTHYGWARLDVSCSFVRHGSLAITATLSGYAFESIPNKRIIAGKTRGPDVITVQPATLGHLAAGASAIPVRRKE
jgi:hypothetical protein